MSTNINPEIEKVSFIGADRSANIILTLDGEPDYIFYRNQNGQTVRTGANLVDIICRLNKLSNKPITRDDFKNVLRTAKDPITKKSEYKFCSIGSPLTKDVKYEYHLNFGMPLVHRINHILGSFGSLFFIFNLILLLVFKAILHYI